MRHLLLATALLLGQAARAQSAAPTDVLLLVNGDEIAGQVLSISPRSISYRALTKPDTLRFDTDAVFLIRFGNGTREVLHDHWRAAPVPAPPAPDALAGLNQLQRRTLGLRDARQHYKHPSAFWVAAGMGLQGGPLGIIAPAVITSRPLPDRNLRAPVPLRLADPTYHAAYAQEARRMRRSKAWGGYAVGLAACVLVWSLASASN